MATQISKKRKFVADGVFRAELNEFFTRELAEEGYSGCDVRVTHARTEVGRFFIIFCRKTILSFVFSMSDRLSSALPTPKKSLEKKDVVSVNLRLLFKSVSSFPKTLLRCMPRKFNTVVSLLSLNARV